MPRCDGSGACSCVIHAGRGMTERGSGTAADPLYLDVVSQDYLGAVDTSTIDMSMTGAGTAGDPRIFSATLIGKLGDLSNVTSNPPSIGQVLGWNGVEWAPQPAASATPGAIVTSGGVTVGDGSSATPLRTAFHTRDFLSGTSGLELSAAVRAADAQVRTDVNALQANVWKMATGSAFATSGGTAKPTATSYPWIFQAGTGVLTSDDIGQCTLIFPQVFPGGVLTVVQSAGDLVEAEAMQDTISRTSVTYRLYNINGWALRPNALYRINYIAIGW